MSKLNDCGILAVQMPLVNDAMFYKTIKELVATDKWKKLNGIKYFHNLEPDETYDILSSVSKKFIMWETTYYHVLPSHSSIIEWYKGSGLRPYLDALEQTEQQDFLIDLINLLKLNFPLHEDSSVILKLPRVFLAFK